MPELIMPELVMRDDVRQGALDAIDAIAPDLHDTSRKMHDEVEYSFQEFKAQAWLCDLLERHGLAVERGLGSLPTAFRALKASQKPGPRIGLLLEMDGLAPYGHSCGHNIGAAAAAGAAIAVAGVIERVGGSVVAIGTPAEDGGGGKGILFRQGFFDGLDAVMLIYPGRDNIALSRALASKRVEFSFFGKAAHAAARPELGVNALDAMNLALSGIAFLRQQVPSDVRIHYMIDKGGTLRNVIPDHTAGSLVVRANELATVDRIAERVEACFQGAAMMTGARAESSWTNGRHPLFSNPTLAGAFERNLQALGQQTRPRDELSGAWGGDTSDLSWNVPLIQPQIAMTDAPPHSREFHEATIEPAARNATVMAAKALALTAIDVMTDGDVLQKVRSDFQTGSLSRPTASQ